MGIMAGKGTVLQVSINSTFTTIASMVEVNAPSLTNPEVDITVLTDPWRQFQYTIPDGGSIDFSGIFDHTHATHSRLITSLSTGTVESMKLIGSTTTNTITFSGLVTAMQIGPYVVDDAARFSGTIKVTSGVTIST